MSRVMFSVLLEQPHLLEQLPRWQHVALERGEGGQCGSAAYFLGSNRETAIEHIESNQQQ